MSYVTVCSVTRNHLNWVKVAMHRTSADEDCGFAFRDMRSSFSSVKPVWNPWMVVGKTSTELFGGHSEQREL